MPFSNQLQEDKITSTEWLQTVLTHKADQNWSDQETIAHFKKALKGKVTGWFFNLQILQIDITKWEDIQCEFVVDYNAWPTKSLKDMWLCAGVTKDEITKVGKAITTHFNKSNHVKNEKKSQFAHDHKDIGLIIESPYLSLQNQHI